MADILGLTAYASDSDHSSNGEKLHTKVVKVDNETKESPAFVNTDPEDAEIQPAENTEPGCETTINIEDSSETVATEKIEKKMNVLDELPPKSEKQPDPEVLEKIHQYLEAKKLHGFDLAQNIKTHKDFGNPYILTKIVEHFQIDEIGSNYPKELYNPHGYSTSDFEENIRRRNIQSQKTQLEPNPSTSNKTKQGSSTSINQATLLLASRVAALNKTKGMEFQKGGIEQQESSYKPSKKRKTKWDEPSQG